MPLAAGADHNIADFVALGSQFPLLVRRMHHDQKIHVARLFKLVRDYNNTLNEVLATPNSS